MLRVGRRVLQQLKREHDGQRIPHIVFTKGGGLWLEDIAAVQSDVVGLDWTVNLGAARARIGDKVALQGNIDPNVLFADPDAIRTEVTRTLETYGRPGGHVFNLGHGMSPDMDPARVVRAAQAAQGRHGGEQVAQPERPQHDDPLHAATLGISGRRR